MFFNFHWNSVIIDEYPDDSADIVFNVRKKDFAGRTAAIDIIATTVKGINHENIINSAPSAVTSVEELKEIMDSWFANDILQRKILSKYGDEFFKDNVLLLERQVDSTGGDGVGIKDVVFSDGKISVYYIKRASDYGICNTDYLCIMQVIVPKSKYNDDKAEWKCFGDVNGDNVFGVADMLTLQKWLSGSADVTMPDWTRADLCRDGQIDVFDLCMLRKQLINCDIKRKNLQRRKGGKQPPFSFSEAKKPVFRFEARDTGLAVYFISVPPHSTTVKPFLSKVSSCWGSMSICSSSGTYAMKRRSRLSGEGVMLSFAASV